MIMDYEQSLELLKWRDWRCRSDEKDKLIDLWKKFHSFQLEQFLLSGWNPDKARTLAPFAATIRLYTSERYDLYKDLNSAMTHLYKHYLEVPEKHLLMSTFSSLVQGAIVSIFVKFGQDYGIKHDVRLFRGMPNLPESERRKYTQGRHFLFPGFTSLSLDPTVAFAFTESGSTDKMLMEVEFNPVPGVWPAIKVEEFSEFNGKLNFEGKIENNEKEVLLFPNTGFRVEVAPSYQSTDGFYYMKLVTVATEEVEKACGKKRTIGRSWDPYAGFWKCPPGHIPDVRYFPECNLKERLRPVYKKA